jgi:hypothetical protein
MHHCVQGRWNAASKNNLQDMGATWAQHEASLMLKGVEISDEYNSVQQ